MVKGGGKCGCFGKLFDKRVLKCLPWVWLVGVSWKRVFVKSAVKETLPEDDCFISVVVPRLRVANLGFSKTLMFGLADGFSNLCFLICVVFGLGVEPDSDYQFWLKDIGLHHHISTCALFLTDRDYFM